MKTAKTDRNVSHDAVMNTQTAPSDPNSILEILGISSLNVDTFNVVHKKDGIHIYITLIKREHRCPVCGTPTTKVCSYRDKKIKHGIVSTSICFIEYHARRYKCPACGKTFYEDNPFTFGNERISTVTVYSVLSDLKNPNETFHSVAQRHGISASTVMNLFDRYVSIPRGKLPYALSIDEVYVPTQGNNKYLCILLNFDTKEIVDVLPSRHKHVLSDYLHKIPLEERNNVKIMSSDMWVSYHDISRIFLHEAQRSVDKFHVMMEFSRQYSAVRCSTMKKYSLIKNAYERERSIRKLNPDEQVIYDEARRNYYAFKKFTWLFYKSNEGCLNPNRKKKFNKVFNRYMNFYDIYDHMFTCDHRYHRSMYSKR